jgi:hypothetical protein
MADAAYRYRFFLLMVFTIFHCLFYDESVYICSCRFHDPDRRLMPDQDEQ